MKMLLVTIASFLLSFSGCSKDPILTEATPPTTEKPIPPVKPVDPTEPVKPIEPTKPGDYTIPANQKDYYAGVDFTKVGMELKAELAKVTTVRHKRDLDYSEIVSAAQQTDLTPDGKSVYLVYGTKGVTSGKNSYTREKGGYEGSGGGKGSDGLMWNKEHVYAKALGTPKLETNSTGPGTDAHHLRPADKDWNAARGSLLFAKGLGLSGKVNGGWYPGDEWKGDVARMMLYMYVRYGKICLPSNVAVGQKNSKDPNMIDLLLEWNATDPVDEIERKRNEYHGNSSNTYAQGNRNPFIDNPYLATQIWGGTPAKNLWTKQFLVNIKTYTKRDNLTDCPFFNATKCQKYPILLCNNPLK